MDATRKASRALLIAWACYALLWAAALTSTAWAPEGAGILVVPLFGLSVLGAALVTMACTIRGLVLFRTPAGTSPWFRALVLVSTVGTTAQLAYAWMFWHG